MSEIAVPWRCIHEFLVSVGSCRDCGTWCRHLVEELSNLLPFDFAYAVLFDAHGRVALCETSHVPERSKLAYFSYYMTVDPCRLCTPAAARTMHTDWGDHRETEFYRDYGRHEGVRFSAGMQLHRRCGRLAGVVFLVRTAPPDFTTGEQTVLEVLQPHLENLLALLLAADQLPRPLAPLPEAAVRAGAAAAKQSGAASLSSRLSPRERNIASLICRGYSTKEISSMLVVRPATVYRHVANVFSKTGVRSRGELVSALLDLR